MKKKILLITFVLLIVLIVYPVHGDDCRSGGVCPDYGGNFMTYTMPSGFASFMIPAPTSEVEVIESNFVPTDAILLVKNDGTNHSTYASVGSEKTTIYITPVAKENTGIIELLLGMIGI